MVWILIAIIVGVIGLDQLTKWLTVHFLELHESFPLWEDVFHFTYERNTGMAFSLLSDQRWIFMTFSTIAIAALTVYLFRFRPQSKWMQVSMAMIIGGGIGNMIDRIFLGYVIDFLDFTLINFAVFNVADSFVCVGAGILIVCLFVDMLREAKKEKLAKEQEKTETAEESPMDSAPDEDAEKAEQTDEERVE